jgi:hypothetical protein
MTWKQIVVTTAIAFILLFGGRQVLVAKAEAKYKTPYPWANKLKAGMSDWLVAYNTALDTNGAKGNIQLCFECGTRLPSNAEPTTRVWVRASDEKALRNHQSRSILLCKSCNCLPVSKLKNATAAWQVLEMSAHVGTKEFDAIQQARLTLVDTSLPGESPSYRAWDLKRRGITKLLQLSKR